MGRAYARPFSYLDLAMFKVGFHDGLAVDPSRPNWSGDGPRPLRWSTWYPAVEGAAVSSFGVPPAAPLFWMGSVAPGADLSPAAPHYPVVLLSHGTGGTAATLGWLACRLAAAGFVVIGVDHHGNTASEPYRPEAFLCWWDRPLDLTAILDLLAADPRFAGRLDLDRVAAVGFSLGGYTVLSLAGAITDVQLFTDWAAEGPVPGGPREFPDIADRVAPLLKSSATFRAAWERQSEPQGDARVASVVALAPAPPVRGFREASLRGLSHVAVTIATGEADVEAPFEACSAWLQSLLPNCTLCSLGAAVGHYQLLGEGTALGLRVMPDIFGDPPGVDRRAVHAAASRIVLDALQGDVPPGPAPKSRS
ncbi:MAG: dienelactone hydrolase domain-containing protein [Xanthobacteraceae bacterium]|nr:MAG: dienelactone hydrolase domain-containing protein [Xanthobacteraceae bacterium]